MINASFISKRNNSKNWLGSFYTVCQSIVDHRQMAEGIYSVLDRYDKPLRCPIIQLNYGIAKRHFNSSNGNLRYRLNKQYLYHSLGKFSRQQIEDILYPYPLNCKPQFYYMKVGFKGVKIIKVCFRDGHDYTLKYY